jgi:hypothetical protein
LDTLAVNLSVRWVIIIVGVIVVGAWFGEWARTHGRKCWHLYVGADCLGRFHILVLLDLVHVDDGLAAADPTGDPFYYFHAVFADNLDLAPAIVVCPAALVKKFDCVDFLGEDAQNVG